MKENLLLLRDLSVCTRQKSAKINALTKEHTTKERKSKERMTKVCKSKERMTKERMTKGHVFIYLTLTFVTYK